MKKLSILLALVSTSTLGAPFDLSIQQYDHFGTSTFNRLVPLPSGGGVDGILVYDQAANLPRLASISGCALSSGVLTCTGSAPAWSALTGTPPAVSVFTNDSGYITSSALSPYATTAALTAGLATKGSGTVTSITAGTGLSGGVITTTGTISMPNTGTAGTYSSVTTDTQGRVTAGTARSQSAQTRTLNSGFQISSTRDALAIYSVQGTVTASIGGGQDGDVILEVASDSGFTVNLQTLSVAPCSQTYTLAIALQGVQKCSMNVSGYIPAAYYSRIRTVNNTGTPAYLYRAGQEVLL